MLPGMLLNNELAKLLTLLTFCQMNSCCCYNKHKIRGKKTRLLLTSVAAQTKVDVRVRAVAYNALEWFSEQVRRSTSSGTDCMRYPLSSTHLGTQWPVGWHPASLCCTYMYTHDVESTENMRHSSPLIHLLLRLLFNCCCCC